MIRMSRRAFGLLGAAQAAGLLSNAAWTASAAESTASDARFDITPYVNPEFRSFVTQYKAFLDANPMKPMSAETLPALRKQAFAMYQATPAVEPTWAERTISGPAGAPDVRVYVINSKTDVPDRPGILHMHGGGFVLGAAKSSIRALQDLAQALDCIIVTVDYRLAPETPFPGAREDNYAALKWLFDHAAELGVDRSRIAVMGESAGGGHAAMLAIAARDRGEVPLKYQALIYPMLDDRTGSTRKVPPYMGALIWTPQANRFGWGALLGVPAGSPRVPRGAVPARVDNLKGLPPAFIGVGSIDLFADEDIEYARRLVDAGIPVELSVIPGAFHGFDNTDTRLARQFKSGLAGALKAAFNSE